MMEHFSHTILWFVDPAIAEIALSQRGLIQEDRVEIFTSDG